MKPQDPTTRIKAYLKTLKLNRMTSALDEELARAVKEASPPSELLGVLPVSVLGSPVRYEISSGYPNTLKRRIADERSRYR